MGRLTFILGGARSGKSEYAQRLAEAAPGPIIFVATAQPLDDEMRERIAAHLQSRPADWQTLELPRGVGEYMTVHSQPAKIVLVDCLTLLVSNIMSQFGEGEVVGQTARAAVESEVRSLLTTIQGSTAEWIIVSNEVGQGIVPAYASGRAFRDLLGWANKEIARRADEVIWMVAGIPVPISGYRLPGT